MFFTSKEDSVEEIILDCPVASGQSSERGTKMRCLPGVYAENISDSRLSEIYLHIFQILFLIYKLFLLYRCFYDTIYGLNHVTIEMCKPSTLH